MSLIRELYSNILIVLYTLTNVSQFLIMRSGYRCWYSTTAIADIAYKVRIGIFFICEHVRLFVELRPQPVANTVFQQLALPWLNEITVAVQPIV